MLATMIDLDKFKKLGSRLPKVIRDWVRNQVQALEGKVRYIDGSDITQEALIGVAIIHLMAMGEQERLEMVKKRAPKLIEMYEEELRQKEGEADSEGPGEADPPKKAKSGARVDPGEGSRPGKARGRGIG